MVSVAFQINAPLLVSPNSFPDISHGINLRIDVMKVTICMLAVVLIPGAIWPRCAENNACHIKCSRHDFSQ